jgi:hypothetical protein
MNDYRENMFFVPLLHLEVRNWEYKRQQLKNIYKNIHLKSFNDNDDRILTDFHDQKITYTKEIENILNEEINLYKLHFQCKTCEVGNSWFEKSGRGNYHEIHNHARSHYSSVCFIDYNANEHTATNFIGPFNNLINGETLTYSPKVNEGSIIFFPSIIHHYTLPNVSDKERLVLSFNIKVG